MNKIWNCKNTTPDCHKSQGKINHNTGFLWPIYTGIRRPEKPLFRHIIRRGGRFSSYECDSISNWRKSLKLPHLQNLYYLKHNKEVRKFSRWSFFGNRPSEVSRNLLINLTWLKNIYGQIKICALTFKEFNFNIFSFKILRNSFFKDCFQALGISSSLSFSYFLFWYSVMKSASNFIFE